MPRLLISDEERFWRKVNKNGPVPKHLTSPCWLWLAALHSTQPYYGIVNWKGKCRLAHRVAWEITHGSQPELNVLHHCDNVFGACVADDHLFLGTDADNVADMVSKSRQHHPNGIKNHFHRLAESDVLEIRRALAAGVPAAELAARFGVVERHIKSIRARRCWRHI